MLNYPQMEVYVNFPLLNRSKDTKIDKGVCQIILMRMDRFDVAVIGGGPGGYVCAIRLAQLGKNVVVIEKDRLGGVCLNHGCIPTKTLITATETLAKVEQLNRIGIKITAAGIDIEKLKRFKDQVVTRLVKGIEFLFKKHGIELVKGNARLEDNTKVAVGGKEIIADRIIIATGTIPYELPPLPYDHQRILSSADLLELARIPKRLLIVGAGAVGLEIGTIYRNLGSQVTIVEMQATILPGCDSEMVSMLKKAIERSGIEIILKTRIEDFKEVDRFDAVLVAVGREPTLPETDLEFGSDKKGFVKVDNRLHTKLQNIYAIGDITGPPLLAHRASHQGIMVAELINGKQEYVLGPIPACVFTHPEYAWVGATEGDIKDAIIGRFPIVASGRAVSMGERDGSCKVIIDPETHQIRGAQIIGPMASELIGSMTVAIKYGIKAEEFEETVHPHPTMSEILPEALAETFDRSIHVSK